MSKEGTAASPSVCVHCGKIIVLKKQGKDACKWVSSKGRLVTWKCGGDPEFPLRAHAPVGKGE